MERVAQKTDVFDLFKNEEGSEELLTLIKNNPNDLKNRFTIVLENDRVILEGNLKIIELGERLINILIRTRRGTYEYSLVINKIDVFYESDKLYIEIKQNSFEESELIYPFLEFSIVILK